MRKTPSKWREFQFAFHQTISAITPKLPLNSVLHNWKTKSPHPSQSQAERDDHNSNRYLSAYGGPPPPIENPKIFETQQLDRKSTRLNSSHLGISYAVFCLKK